MSASVNSTYIRLGPAARRPWAMAHTLPAQRSPSGGGAPETTRSGRPALAAIRAATSPVPSELPSSTTMTVSAPG